MMRALVIGRHLDLRPAGGHNHDRLVADGAVYAVLGVAPTARAETRSQGSWWSRVWSWR
jgi:hypothetical protein